MMEKYIFQPSYYKGIKENCIGVQDNINLIGADSETKPYRLIGIGNNNNVTTNFLSIKNFLRDLDYQSKTHFTNVCFFHVLKFDMQVIFLKHKSKFMDSNSLDLYFDTNYEIITDEKEINLKRYYVKVKLFYSKIWFMRIVFNSHKHCLVLDSYSFLKGSLKNLSNDLNLEVKKYEVEFDSVNKKELTKYLINDVKTEYYLGQRIIDFHKEYDVRISVSIAQLASRIFRHKFIKDKDTIPKMPHDLIGGCIKSYHGGKNTYIGDKVTKFENVKYYDVNSLYPYAMSKIPNFLNCEYKTIIKYNPDKEGVYQIYGDLKKSKYAIFYSHGFDKIDRNFKGNDIIIDMGDYFKIKGLWVTSYELRKALEHDLFNFRNKGINPTKEYSNCIGIIVKESPDVKYNPLKDFVTHFYNKKKETSSNHPFYLFYKTCLNSLYGKFIQNMNYSVPDEDIYDEMPDGSFKKREKKFKGGGLFNPLIATLITGFSRAYMFDFEVKYNSIHTATDSIMTYEDIPTGKELGDFRLEDQGDVIIFRSKLYIFFGKTLKYARHGFHGSIQTLLSMFIKKEKTYKATRFINIKESMRCKDRKAGEFQELDYNLNVKF